MIVVYSLLAEEHPASRLCEGIVRSAPAPFTTSVNLLEISAVLNKVYGIERMRPGLVVEKLSRLSDLGIIEVIEVDAQAALSALRISAKEGIDYNDAVLLDAARRSGAGHVLTSDRNMIRACRAHDIRAEDPFDDDLRQAIAQWEEAYLPPKGIARILHRIYLWLRSEHPHVAESFWSHTGAGAHLP